MAIALAIKIGPRAEGLYEQVESWAVEEGVDPTLLETIRGAASGPPADYMERQGWVLIALGNALWQLLHAPDLEAGVVDTVMRGAVYGVEAIPAQWVERVLSCRPEAGRAGVHRPRPECFWPVDGLGLAAALLGEG